MDLRDKFSYLNTRQKVLFITAFVLVLIFIILLVIYIVKPKQSVEVIEEPTPVEIIIDEEPEPVEEPIVSVDQEKVSNMIVGTVTKITDLGSKAYLTILLSSASDVEEVNIIADIDTEFFDIESQLKFDFSELIEGDKVVVYASGNYRISTVNADVILKGDSTEYSYGRLKSIVQGSDGLQSWILYDTNDKLRVLPKEVHMIDGYTGLVGDASAVLTDNSKVLYKYKPDFEISDNGNIYDCTDIIILSY